MILPPRTLAIRLFFWTALLAYAIWILRDRRADEVFVAEPVPVVDRRVALTPPSTPPSVTGAPANVPAIVDVEAAVGAMDAAVAAMASCGVTGTFSVRLDAGGLAEAWIEPPEGAPLPPEVQACAARAAWAPTWPATVQGFEMERAIAQ